MISLIALIVSMQAYAADTDRPIDGSLACLATTSPTMVKSLTPYSKTRGSRPERSERADPEQARYRSISGGSG
jgi:hypothetical protein